MNSPFNEQLHGKEEVLQQTQQYNDMLTDHYGEAAYNDDHKIAVAAQDTEDSYMQQTRSNEFDQSEAHEMINLNVPQPDEPQLKPCITVIGVGGAGGNAVNNMIADNLQGVDFVVANTDAQALSFARTDRRIQLGATTTQGLGAGAKPDVGRAAAEESVESIAEQIQGANMVFITAGMGGGTGTGAAPIIARTAREMGILTVGVVTKPFQFEGAHRMRLAEAGIEELSQFVDTLIIIPNQNLFRVANEKTTFADAFRMADNVLNAGVRSITDLMIMPGLINLDFADVRTVMSDMGRAMMGTGEADGERRALEAAEAAIANPLLEDTCMKGAKGVLINITGGPDITLFEVDEAANRIRDEVEGEAHIIFGSCFDPDMQGKMRVSVVATGITAGAAVAARPTTSSGVMGHDPMQQMARPVQQPITAPRPNQPPIAAPRPAYAPQGPAVQQRPNPAAGHQQPVHQQPISQPGVQQSLPQQAPAQPVAPAPQQATGHHYVPQVPAQTYAPQQAAYPAQSPMQAPTQSAPMQPPMQRPQQGYDMPDPRKASDAFIPAAPVGRTDGGMAAGVATAAAPLLDMPSRPNAFAQQTPARPEPRPAMAAEQRTPITNTARPEPRQAGGFLKGLAAKLSPSREHHDAYDEQPAPVAPPMPSADPGSLSVNPADRPVAQSRQDEDALEIPAFLRRQAN
ncbi:cell division protein FtsZ [Insolitispirillum peregrinum]|uniref:Cell division protein FtsZ n=2 Tax=Insolitispirillum peregrinum TaxID=80876 RepID=A0A1N7LNY9_9PROT|nr:cell division protein FtsZ [Insolitispirillum peregrinum]